MGFIRKAGLLLAAILLAALATPSYICLAQSATVAVNNGNTITLDPGGSTSESLRISSIPDPGVGAFTINLSWNNSVINVDNITAGSGPSGFTIIVGDPSGGSVTVSGFGTTTPITSSTTVANLDITAVGDPGSSTTINS